MSEKLDPLTPLGRKVLNEIKEREPFVAPGGKYQLADPPELGWVETPTPPQHNIDWSFIRSLVSMPGNEYEEREAA